MTRECLRATAGSMPTRATTATSRTAVALLALGLALGCSDAPETAPSEASAPQASSGAPPAGPDQTPTTQEAAPVQATPAKASPAQAVRAEPAPSHEALVARGRSVYAANCIACHNPDPSRDGGLGPAVAGSSRELLEARVLRAEYPPGYEPKRKTGVMIALPHLENDIDALTAYLAEAAEGS